MEVLDTTIANVALHYIAGGLGVSEDEASWVVTTYLVSNAVILTASQLSRSAARPQAFLPHLPCACSRRARCCAASRGNLQIAAAVPHPAGARRRRHGAGLAVDPRRLLSAGEARTGFRAVRRRGRRRARGRPDARRLAVRQSVLALVFPHQRPGRRRRDRADRGSLARDRRGRSKSASGCCARAAGSMSSASLLVATFLGSLEVMLDRGLEDDWFGSPSSS